MDESTGIHKLDGPLLNKIASYLDYKHIKELKLVNRRWYGVYSSQNFWRELCKVRGRTIPSPSFLASLDRVKSQLDRSFDFDYERLFVFDPFGSNIALARPNPLITTLKGGCGWQITYMKVESPPHMPVQFPDIEECLYPDPNGNCCSKILRFKLTDYGIPGWLLDHIRPRITVYEWIATGAGAHCYYRMFVVLCPDHGGVGKYHSNGYDFHPNPNANPWIKAVMDLDEYPRGMREMEIRSHSYDSLNRIGMPGVKMANLTVNVELPDEFKWFGSLKKVVRSERKKKKKKERKEIVKKEKKEEEERRRSDRIKKIQPPRRSKRLSQGSKK